MTSDCRVSYRRSDEAWSGYEAFLCKLIEDRKVLSVCDIGGGANPVLSAEYVRQKSLEYTVLDLSESELAKAPDTYQKVVADIASKDYRVTDQKYDLVFSKMLAEHILDAPQFHKNIRSLLSPGGVAVHFFPTLYAFPFVVNWLVPEKLSDLLLNLFAPRDRYQHAKFPAYYQWCRGPTTGQFRRLSSVGLRAVEYIGFFGHGAYYRRLPGVRLFHEMATRVLMRYPNPHLTSFAYMMVTREETFESAKDPIS